MEIDRFVLGKAYNERRSFFKYKRVEPLPPQWGSLGVSEEFQITAPID